MQCIASPSQGFLPCLCENGSHRSVCLVLWDEEQRLLVIQRLFGGIRWEVLLIVTPDALKEGEVCPCVVAEPVLHVIVIVLWLNRAEKAWQATTYQV